MAQPTMEFNINWILPESGTLVLCIAETLLLHSCYAIHQTTKRCYRDEVLLQSPPPPPPAKPAPLPPLSHPNIWMSRCYARSALISPCQLHQAGPDYNKKKNNNNNSTNISIAKNLILRLRDCSVCTHAHKHTGTRTHGNTHTWNKRGPFQAMQEDDNCF